MQQYESNYSQVTLKQNTQKRFEPSSIPFAHDRERTRT